MVSSLASQLPNSTCQRDGLKLINQLIRRRWLVFPLGPCCLPRWEQVTPWEADTVYAFGAVGLRPRASHRSLPTTGCVCHPAAPLSPLCLLTQDEGTLT